MINESTVHFKDNGGDLEKALMEFKVCASIFMFLVYMQYSE